ncbi:lipoprotein [Listeria cornellensis FSL F6-0969]|uniref:Lipoprotein n=2 Tax=Listeria cornellensis TaxID=1494961 RepID=W7BJ76_9LIST|nr:lipoprotein [Listeria cornellensis FSL F6-0969]
MSFLNNDNGPVGVGAFDFKIKSGGKTYDVFPQGNNFGDEFKPNEKLEGKAYFELPTSVKKGTLVYAPMDKELASWSIVIPEAK